MNSKSDYYRIREQANRLRHQFYFLDMPQAPSSALSDIFEFEGTRAIGEPTRFRIRFTHPSHSLSRTEYIGKMAAFVVQPPTIERYGFTRTEAGHYTHGVVTSFAWLGSSNDESTYEIVLESRLALLRNTPKVRFFYDMSIPDVLMQILKENGFDRLQASFDFPQFYYTYEQRPIITQWEEDDLTFLQRLCRRSGIWFVCEAGDSQERIVFGDGLTHYLRGEEFHMAYRPPSGMNDNGGESVESLTMHATSIPQSYSVRSYHPDNGYEPIDASAVIHDDKTTYGDAYTYGLPYQTKKDADSEVQLRQRVALAHQIKYEGVTNKIGLGPRCVVKLTNRDLADAEHGLLIESIKVSASRKQRYKVEFTAIPCDRFYHLPLREETWPRITGTITGTIASPNDYAHPFISKHGQYVVQLHPDRDSRRPGANSCLMRLAKPYAGKHYTGMHFGLVDGTLVAVGFHHGNPDLPFIAHAMHSSVHPDPINSEDRWLSRDTIHFRSNNTIESENWQGQEHLKLSTEHGKSQLNLGHTVSRNPERKHRGSGFELRSDMRGAVRAGGGLLLSAETQAKVQGDIADMAGAKQIYQRTQEQADALMQAVSAAKAEVADLKAERQWLKDELADLKKSVIALSAPAGIAVATPDRVSVAAGKDVNVTTLWGFNVSAMKNVAMAAKEKVSLFAYRMGIGIRAAQGPVEIQAQSDVMSLAAQKDMTVSSVDGAMRVRAKQDVMIECGGAFIEIKDGNITLGGPGKLLFKFASMSKQRAQMAHLSAPAFATTTVPFKTSCEAWLSGNTTVAKVSPAPQFVDWKQFQNLGAVPAAPDAAAVDANTQSPDAPDADHDSKHEPKLPTTSKGGESEPIKLGKRVYCDWTLKKLERECSDATETGPYHSLDRDKNAWPSSGAIGGAQMPSCFSLSYDADSKTLTASVRIKVVPVDLIRSDPYGTPILASGIKQSVPYHHDKHAAVTAVEVGQPVGGNLVLEYREAVGSDFNVAKKKREVESVLNNHKSLLILDGCSRGASCGCGVKVVFNVDFLLSIKNANVGSVHKEIWLFPQAERADAGSWGEQNVARKKYRPDQLESVPQWNVVAHECGHLFNFPDEYWPYGGWVHVKYINGQDLDFQLGQKLTAKQTWQIQSDDNLMGYGAVHRFASVSPYYLEYVRKHFSEMTNKKWRVGYED